jgi:hypothetical protein
MHPSYFMILESVEESCENELTLSGETSEWLFHKKFWEKVSSKFQKDFAQYEEEVFPGEFANGLAELIDCIMHSLKKEGADIVRFRYGWNQNREELISLVDPRAIIDELTNLIRLFRRAGDKRLDVYCQL